MRWLLSTVRSSAKRYVAEVQAHKALFSAMLLFIICAIAVFRWILQKSPIADGTAITLADTVIWLYDPSRFGVSVVWSIIPIVTLIWLARIWTDRETSNWIVRQKSRKAIWLSEIMDALVTSMVVAVFTHVLVVALGRCSPDGLINFADSHSLFAQYAGDGTTSDISIANVLVWGFTFCFLALTVSNVLFALFRWLAGNTLVPLVLVILLGLPQVHGQNAFLLEIARALSPFASQMINPLSYLYGTTSIFYPTWVQGGSHSFVFLIGVIGSIIFLGFFFANRRKEHL